VPDRPPQRMADRFSPKEALEVFWFGDKAPSRLFVQKNGVGSGLRWKKSCKHLENSAAAWEMVDGMIKGTATGKRFKRQR